MCAFIETELRRYDRGKMPFHRRETRVIVSYESTHLNELMG